MPNSSCFVLFCFALLCFALLGFVLVFIFDFVFIALCLFLFSFVRLLRASCETQTASAGITGDLAGAHGMVLILYGMVLGINMVLQNGMSMLLCVCYRDPFLPHSPPTHV